MSDRIAGFYFVQHGGFDGWLPAVLCNDGRWMIPGFGKYLNESNFEKIGGRIPAPDEPWQCVPREPTGAMYKALKNPEHPGGIDFYALLKWKAALSAAPKPGDV